MGSLAEEGLIDPVIGRKNEITRVMQILGRRNKNNPCLIGEPGVGKTSIAEGLAQKIVAKNVPDSLTDKRVVSLDVAMMISGTKYRGEFESRVTRLLSEVKGNAGVILMIDEVHTLIGSGSAEGSMDIANMIKPALARGEMQCIGATTIDEFRRYIESDPALERRFQPVHVPEPSVEDSIQIIKGLRERYEEYHKLRYSDEAIKCAVEYSHQYITDRYLPDKAIDLIDEAGSAARLKRTMPSELADTEKYREMLAELRKLEKEKKEAVESKDFERAARTLERITQQRKSLQNMLESSSTDSPVSLTPEIVVSENDIASVVSSWTGIPVVKVTSEESQKLTKIEETLHSAVIGQDEAVTAVSRAIRRCRAGLRNTNRPISSFIFAGPTGVGKSELAKSLASYYFGSEEAMIRLDMSEFMERHNVSKLIGSPPGYVGFEEGGQLTEAVRRRPYTIVLFDEIEKAHPEVFNIMLQVLEDGRLTDSTGRVINFSNTLIILTSNVGSQAFDNGGVGIGFQLDTKEEESYNRVKALVNDALKQTFRPEFLNRLDDIIVFRKLTKDDVKQIADVFLRGVISRASDKGLTLEITEKFKEGLADEGYNPSYGARPLRRAITRMIEDTVAEGLLENNILEGDTVILGMNSDKQIVVSTERKTYIRS